MSLTIIQTCEPCGKRRELAKNDKEELSGWRKLNVGNKEITICDICLRDVIEHVLTRVARRKDGNDPDDLTFEFHEHKE